MIDHIPIAQTRGQRFRYCLPVRRNDGTSQTLPGQLGPTGGNPNPGGSIPPFASSRHHQVFAHAAIGLSPSPNGHRVFTIAASAYFIVATSYR